MEIGIAASTFRRPALGECLGAVIGNGIRHVQFNLSCAGLEDMPVQIEEVEARRIGEEVRAEGVEIAAVSGTFNMIHPDPWIRREGLWRLRALVVACEWLGTPLITLCTGSRDPDNMWRRHPENDSAEAWSDLRDLMTDAVAIAEGSRVMLGVEPEVSNVVDSAAKARRLLDEIGSPALKIVMDGANLYHRGELPHMRAILDEAFDLLGPDIALAHAKDVDHDGEAGHLPAGRGLLDYDHYLGLLTTARYEGPLILHSLTEAQVPECVSFLRQKLSCLT